MPNLSEAVIRMSTLDRTKQEVDWYIDEINLCVDVYHNYHIADKIKAECKRRGIPCMSVRTREMTRGVKYTIHEKLLTPSYNIQKICLPQSSEVLQGYDESIRRLYPDCCVSALEKKQLVDWVVTKYNKYCGKKGNEAHSDNYVVWVQPDSDVDTWSNETEAMDGLATDWIRR